MKDLSLYIHIPFCKTICLYCNFKTYANKAHYIPDYVQALTEEIKSRAKYLTDYEIQTIYFGGGTPSLIDSKYIGYILDTVKSEFSTKANMEISIECNPESLDSEKLAHYVQFGINRISLGAQTFHKKALWKVARPHDELAIRSSLNLLQSSQFPNFGVDFIIGMPYQTEESFRNELDEVLQYEPHHLSYYFLSLDTPKIELFIADSPGEDLQVRMYSHLIKKLKTAGYLHYEVSNYAKPGYECQHNQRYWQRKEYLGLGMGAHSYMAEHVWENAENMAAYLKNPLTIIDKTSLDPDLQRMDFIMLLLRQRTGIDLETYEKNYGAEKLSKLLENASQYVDQGALEKADNHLRPSEFGFLIVDRITRDLTI